MKCIAARAPLAWRWVGLGLALSVAGAFGLVNLASAHPVQDGPVPHGTPPAHAPDHGAHHGPDRGPGHPAGPGLGLPLLGGPLPERLLDDIQASATQREQLQRIAEATRADLRARAETERPDPARLAELLAQPVVDEAAVEALRRQAVQRHDEASRRIQVAMIEAAKVLTPAQRTQIADRLKQRAERMAERPERPEPTDRRGAPGAEPPPPQR